ncbi:hypothetical protein [Sphingomonas lenta]|uniref:Uncharacterized protein n=1 Tax=Sphingomonas lenta TaxID=1141887 RepID=A0A2A2SDC8_9SPHN|nr:hypothetical protein [Sphingomonas lenta]PAX07294.1 hypothetical protein CKY28_14845 [Sphingomonas lenta]
MARDYSDVDAQIERAREVMARISADYAGTGKRVRRKARSAGRKLVRILVANALILLAAMVAGFFVPLGLFGGLAVMLLMAAVTIGIMLAPAERVVTEEKLRAVDVRALPAQTERWLERQRPALPPPARTLVDQIGVRLETLSPQLANVPNDGEAAYELRRLIGEQLPAFVGDYQKVPPPLRAQVRNGRTPDAQLVDGLKLIDQEIAMMTERLAQGNLDSLQTRGRYLEMKYRDGDQG